MRRLFLSFTQECGWRVVCCCETEYSGIFVTTDRAGRKLMSIPENVWAKRRNGQFCNPRKIIGV